MLYAPFILVQSGGRLSARGADGAVGGSGAHTCTPGAGGGGNGGGVICLIGETAIINGSIDLSGGSGGSGGVTGSYGLMNAGANGTLGRLLVKNIDV